MDTTTSIPLAKTYHDRVEIAYETFGSPPNEPLLLIMGVGMQMLLWHTDFCTALVDRGFMVARFDNRDVGLSTHFSAAGVPSLLKMITRPAIAASYQIDDMADDAVAVLDALGWGSAHVVGGSLGGMIAQAMAIRHPSRVRTLTSMMSTPSPRIGRMKIRIAMTLARLQKQAVTSREDAAQRMVDMYQIIGSPGYPSDEAWLREVGRQSYDRGHDPGGRLRQQAAMLASGDRRAALAKLRLPTLVVHGEDDPIFLPSGGYATAAAIPDARYVTYAGMGHNLPRALWPTIIDEICVVAEAYTRRRRAAA
jgi:pimeloyl-ACP methyl ester carboxylesterase